MIPTIYKSREEWLDARKQTIGASDVPVILGLSKWKSAYTLWCEKTGRIEPEDMSIAAETGLALEPLITRFYEKATGLETFDPGSFTIYRHPDYEWLTCTPDRFAGRPWVYPYDRAVELKSIGENTARQMKGDALLHHQVQLQAQLAVLGLEYGDLACLIANRKFEIFPYERHDELIRKITPKIKEFYDRMMSDDPPPVDGSESTYRALTILHPDDNGDTIQLPKKITTAYQRIERNKLKVKDISAKTDLLENIIRAAMGKNTFCEADGLTLSLKTQERKGSLRVSPEYKELLDKHGIKYSETKESKTRVLRPVKGK